jgi:hypothetical protein
MSEYLRAEKEAERERARCRHLDAEVSSREIRTPAPESLGEPASQLLRLLVEEPAEGESRRRRWREHGRRGLWFMGVGTLIVGLAWLLGSSSLAWLAALRQTASTPITIAVETPRIPSTKNPTRSVVGTDTPTVLFRIQVGAFVNSSNAERLADRLRSEGFVVSSRILHAGAENAMPRTLHVIRVGAYRTAGTAEHARAELARLGYHGFVVREH